MSINTNHQTNDFIITSASTNADLNLSPKGTGKVKITSGGLTFPDNTTQTTAATGGGGGATYGEISFFASTTPQAGFVAANGGSLVKSSYPNLTGLLPDFLSTSALTPALNDCRAITWSGTKFCAIQRFSNNVSTSTNGTTWTTLPNMPSSSNWSSVAWNGSVFCAVVSNSTIAATSPDGITWTARTLPSSSNWVAIAASGSIFCVVSSSSGENLISSNNGVTWTSVFEGNNVTSSGFNQIAGNGSIFIKLNPTANQVVTSPDGINWTYRLLPLTQNYTLNSITWNGSVFCALAYYAVSYDAYALTSSDGITWNANPMPRPVEIDNQYWGVISNGSSLLAFSQFGETQSIAVISYTNGRTWFPVNVPSGSGWQSGAGNPTTYVVLSNNSSAFTATADVTKFAVPKLTADIGAVPMMRVS